MVVFASRIASPAANKHDATPLLPLVDAIPSIIGPCGKPGRPRNRPGKLHADKAYEPSELRRALRSRGITPRIARRGIDSSERRADLLQGLLYLACALLCVRYLATAPACGEMAR